MPWIVYETRNRINGRVYVGVHKQEGRGFDGYLGSGTALEQAVAKYGKDKFTRRTLHTFDTPEEAYEQESRIVTEEWCRSKQNYNQKAGGRGGHGWKHTRRVRNLLSKIHTGRPKSDEAKRKISETLTGVKHTKERRQRISKAMSVANLGRVLSDETKKLLSERMKETWRKRKMTNGP